MTMTPDTGAQAVPEQQTGTQAAPANETTEAKLARLEAEAAETRREAASYRKRLREREQADEAAQRDAQAAQEAALAEQGRFRDLYEAEKAKTAQATTLAETVARYEATLLKHAAALADGVPDAVKTLLAKMSPADQVDWLIDNRASLVSAPAPPTPPTPPRGTPPGSRPAAQRPLTTQPATAPEAERPLVKF